MMNESSYWYSFSDSEHLFTPRCIQIVRCSNGKWRNENWTLNIKHIHKNNEKKCFFRLILTRNMSNSIRSWIVGWQSSAPSYRWLLMSNTFHIQYYLNQIFRVRLTSENDDENPTACCKIHYTSHFHIPEYWGYIIGYDWHLLIKSKW